MGKRSVPSSHKQYVVNSPALRVARELPGINARPYPGFIDPALATLTDIPRTGDAWLHEIKYDGYRLQVHVLDAGMHAYTRRGHDWSNRFKPIIATAGLLKTRAAILDGEVVVQSKEGRSDFGALEADLGAGRSDRLIYYAFDLLYLDGFDLRAVPLIDRKRVLSELLGDMPGPIRFSEHLEGDGKAIFRNACELDLEGIVSKLKNAKYRSRRNDNWVKLTCRKRDTFPIVGYALKGGKFDGLYLGRRVGRGLEYAGKVETGFTDQTAKSVVERLRPLLVRAQALRTKISKPKAQWVRPSILAEVEYRALTGDGKVRHPSFKGIREDLGRRE